METCGRVSRLLADVRCAGPAGNQCLRHVSLRQKISTATSTCSHFGSFLWPISGSSVKGYV
ncbi:hypothetical protein CGCVW01_v002744 [Colletotrichum viniferum]|nr:hypothetical protein CGCVW01_v002744 [Colletotrichum viniferum]